MLLVASSACETTPPTPNAIPAATPVATTPAVSPTPDASGAASIARLTAALDTLSSGYTFESTVLVGDTEATRAEGRWVGGASEFDVTAAGATVTYRSVPPDAWVRKADGKWTKLDGAPPAGDPLAVLGSPLSVEITSESPDTTELVATYPAASLGVAGPGNVAVHVAIASDGSLSVTYTTAVPGAGGATGTASTHLAPASGLPPITAP